MKYNFKIFGNVMGYNFKMKKHVESRNCDRIKDYICSGFDTFNPRQYKDHPSWEFIEEGIEVLKSEGWKVYIRDWKELGRQIVLISPENHYYHSNYNYKYDFNTVGGVIGYNLKIEKHINKKDCDRIKDYLCIGFDTFNPDKHSEHPSWEFIEEGIEILKNEGWSIKLRNLKEIGKQLVVMSPEGDCYHSKYSHN